MNVEKKSISDRARIDALKHLFSSYEENPEEVLASLNGRRDSESIRQKLAVLLNSKGYEEAAKLVIKKKPSTAWYDLAVVALTNGGYIDKVAQVLRWASKQEPEIWHRAIHLYVVAQFKRIWRRRKNVREIAIGSLDATEKKELRQLIQTVQPVLKYIEGLGRVTGKAQEETLNIALKSYAILGDKENTSKYSSYSHDSLTLASLALSGDIEVSEALITNLEKNYPDSYDAQKFSILLRTQCGTLLAENFDEAIRTLCKYSSSRERRIEIFQILRSVAYELGGPATQAFEKNVTSLLDEDEHLVKLYRCEKLLHQESLPQAGKILAEAKDETDPTWLQLYGQYMHLKGRPEDALEYFDKALSLFPHPGLRKSVAKLAFETENYDRSIEVLKEELKSEPANISHLNNIATACFRKGDYKAAADYYARLIEITREDLTPYLNLATCYVQTGDSQKAIEAYDVICKRDDAPLDAFLARSYLIRITDPVKAFDLILPLKDKYWDNPQYLQAILDLSYRAGKEEYGHHALLKLRQLQSQGKAPQEVVQAKTIQDLKVYMDEWNKKVEIINKNLLTGKFPWLMADHWQNHSAYMGWHIRTQSFNWKMEEPMTCASYSVYSTNGFRSVKQNDNTTVLDSIGCPAKNGDIVIDLSALITLHRLDLLNKFFEYFNKIYVPKEYPVLLLKDSESLVIHQLTRKTTAEMIKKEIDAGHIAVLDDIGLPGKRSLPFVHEHTLPEKEEEHYYRLIDIIDVSYNAGKLEESKYSNLKRISHKPSGNDPNHPPLNYGESILVDAHTLYSICQLEPDALTSILEAFKVFVSKSDQIRNANDITQIAMQENIKSMNDDLLSICRKEDKIIKEAHTRELDLGEEEDFLASWKLAKGISIPLFTDDRVLQNLAINENTDVEHAAFGTDALLIMLQKENVIDIDTLVDAFLQLISWRYRFIVPTKEIFVHLAKRYGSRLPGKDLQQIASYVHDCMRDPGLFGGKENTSRNESMAARLFVSWLRVISEFLVDVWGDSEFSEEAAKALTKWTVNEFMPSLPKSLGPTGLGLAENVSSAFLSYFLGFALLIDDTARASKALQVIAECLNMGEADYFKAVTLVVDKYGI